MVCLLLLLLLLLLWLLLLWLQLLLLFLLSLSALLFLLLLLFFFGVVIFVVVVVAVAVIAFCGLLAQASRLSFPPALGPGSLAGLVRLRRLAALGGYAIRGGPVGGAMRPMKSLRSPERLQGHTRWRT